MADFSRRTLLIGAGAFGAAAPLLLSTRGLTQPIRLIGCEKARSYPSKRRSIQVGSDGIFAQLAWRAAFKPAPAGIAGLICRFRRWKPPGRKSQGLDHLSAVGAPQPGAPGDQGVRERERQSAAGERHAVLDQVCAELRQPLVGTRRLSGRIDEPRNCRGELHGLIMGLTRLHCHLLCPDAWL